MNLSFIIHCWTFRPFIMLIMLILMAIISMSVDVAPTKGWEIKVTNDLLLSLAILFAFCFEKKNAKFLFKVEIEKHWRILHLDSYKRASSNTFNFKVRNILPCFEILVRYFSQYLFSGFFLFGFKNLKSLFEHKEQFLSH